MKSKVLVHHPSSPVTINLHGHLFCGRSSQEAGHLVAEGCTCPARSRNQSWSCSIQLCSGDLLRCRPRLSPRICPHLQKPCLLQQTEVHPNYKSKGVTGFQPGGGSFGYFVSCEGQHISVDLQHEQRALVYGPGLATPCAIPSKALSYLGISIFIWELRASLGRVTNHLIYPALEEVQDGGLSTSNPGELWLTLSL